MKYLKRAFITLSFIFFVNIVAFSQTLLLEPQSSISIISRYLGNGKYSDSISICITYLYDTKVVKKYKTYITADLNDYLPSSDNVADWNCTEMTEDEEELLKRQGVVVCDTVINNEVIVGWYKVSHKTIEEKRIQPKRNMNKDEFGIYKNQSRNKYKPIRTKEDLIKALENLKSNKKN